MTELKPFRIGPIEIDFPVALAPLAGYSDHAFRSICRQQGAAYCTTEMVLDRCATVRRGQQAILLSRGPDEHPLAVQIIGTDAATMAGAARFLAGEGFDVIDLNFACPVNKALRRRRGGYLMQEPAQVVAIVEAVANAVDIPVTLKVRQRFADDDSEDAFWQLARGAKKAGAAGIIVHGRSVEQKYRGSADWNFIGRVKAEFSGTNDWTVMGSGDVLTARAALAMLAETGVDAVCAARGVIGNPWLFRQARDLAAGRPPHVPDLTEQRRMILQHMDLAVDLYGPDKAPRIMRKFGIKYARMHPTPKAVRMAFVAVRTPADWQAVLDRYYGESV
ncbi:MAG: tRNA-dihydrouridine synthase [Phycisphaerae bacterium]|nr:tRNA-dihydrouridine synthase [Phycisphaerae bacterium]